MPGPGQASTAIRDGSEPRRPNHARTDTDGVIITSVEERALYTPPRVARRRTTTIASVPRLVS